MGDLGHRAQHLLPDGGQPPAPCQSPGKLSHSDSGGHELGPAVGRGHNTGSRAEARGRAGARGRRDRPGSAGGRAGGLGGVQARGGTRAPWGPGGGRAGAQRARGAQLREAVGPGCSKSVPRFADVETEGHKCLFGGFPKDSRLARDQGRSPKKFDYPVSRYYLCFIRQIWVKV